MGGGGGISPILQFGPICQILTSEKISKHKREISTHKLPNVENVKKSSVEFYNTYVCIT